MPKLLCEGDKEGDLSNRDLFDFSAHEHPIVLAPLFKSRFLSLLNFL